MSRPATRTIVTPARARLKRHSLSPAFLAMIPMLLAAPCLPHAQDRGAADYRYTAALSLFGGGASGTSGTGAALGWSFEWAPKPRLAIEAGGWWTGEPAVDGFAALIGPRASLTRPSRVTPFVSMEVGLFRASVDGAEPDVPTYYRERMTDGRQRRTFDDFVAAPGAGVDVYLAKHVAIRPHVRVLFAIADGIARPIVVYGAHVSYNFLEHPGTQ